MSRDPVPPQPDRHPPAGAPSPDVRKIIARLGALRRRVRGIFATIAIGRWVVGAVVVLGAFFLADWLLDLPLAVRRFTRLGLLQPPASLSSVLHIPLVAVCALLAVVLTRRRHGAAPVFAFLVAGVVGVLAWFAVRVCQPLRVGLPDDDLALSVESRFKHLNDRLAAALDFDRELRNPTRGESPAMMRAVIQEAADEVRGLQFSRAVSGARGVRWAGLALAACGAAAAVAVLFSDTVGLWAQRSLLLSDVSWPRATTIVAVDLTPDGAVARHEPERPYAVPIGRVLTVYALAMGEIPDGAQVLDLVPGQDPLARRMFPVPGSEGLFAYEFRDVRRPFSFILRGGDDDDDKPQYSVTITIPPRVLDIESTITFPAYIGREPEVVADGSVTVPEGSTVAVRFEPDVEIAEARAVIGEQSIPAERIEGPAGTSFGFSYVATESAQFRLVMKTPDGKMNDAAADTYEIRVKLDQPPRVEWIYPRTSVEVTPNGRVPLLVRATDDHGVSLLTLEMRTGGDVVTSYELRAHDAADDGPEDGQDGDVGPPLAVNDGAYGRLRVLSYLPLEIEDLRTPEDQVMAAPAAPAFRIVARDSRGQVRESDWTRVDVGTAPILERGLSSQRSNVRLSIEAVQRDQQARRDDVAVLAGALDKGGLDRGDLDQLKTIRFAQSKIAQDADRAVQELFSVFNGFVYDRLGSPNANAKILAYLDRHHRATYGLPQADEEGPGGERTPGTREWLGDPVFPYATYREIIAAWRSKEIYDKGLLDKMCAVVADAAAVGSTLAPRAHAAATQAVSGSAEDVRALLAAQDANLAALDALLDSMRGWQSLSDVTLWLRGIIEEQKALQELMDAESKKRNR